MRHLLKCTLLGVGLVLGTSSIAYAGSTDLFGFDYFLPPPKPHLPLPVYPNHNPPRLAPEIDPDMAVGGFSLLAGMLIVLRSRRRSRD